MFRYPLLAKIGLTTATGSLVGVLGFTDVVDYNQIGVVRIARAGFTVAAIAADYKWTFFRSKHPITSQEYQQELSQVHRRSAEKLKELCCKNRGTFIKVGQHLGSLDYILPAEYVNEMKCCFRDAPQSSFADMLTVLCNELNLNKASDLFTEIDPTPLGAASLAQVHKATLKNGTTVAVKIQHPNVAAQAALDMKAMKFLVTAVAKVFPDFQFIWLAEETEKLLPLELDFINEGKNCERLALLLSKFDFVKLPKIHWRYSTDRVLVMEYCDGGRIDDLDYYKAHGISPEKAFCQISKVFNEMIFVDGYLHCDPHPGNILVSSSPSGSPILTLLDHGVHLKISENTRLSYSRLWLSLLNADLGGMQKHAGELGVGDLFDVFACMLAARSWTGVKSGIQNSVVGEKEMEEIKYRVGKILPEISSILNRVPREVLLILKTNDLLRGLSCKLKSIWLNMASSNPNPRPLRTVRDLRDNTWMVREGLAEIERDQVLKNAGPVVRYELSQVPYLGTDGKATMRDLVPHPRKIYEDDSEFIKVSKRGGDKNLIWWHPDFPLEAVPEKNQRLLRPKPAEWSVHPASLLPNPHEDFAKNRKLPPTHNEPTPRELLRPGKTPRLDASKMPPAIGAPRHYSWEPALKQEGYNFYKIMTNGYLPAHLHENRKKAYFESLIERPQNEQEKLQDQIFHEQREHNRKLRETALRFDRMTRGQASWTEHEHMNTRGYLFPNGWGRGMRAPQREKKCVIRATDGLAGH